MKYINRNIVEQATHVLNIFVRIKSFSNCSKTENFKIKYIKKKEPQTQKYTINTRKHNKHNKQTRKT